MKTGAMLSAMNESDLQLPTFLTSLYKAIPISQRMLDGLNNLQFAAGMPRFELLLKIDEIVRPQPNEKIIGVISKITLVELDKNSLMLKVESAENISETKVKSNIPVKMENNDLDGLKAFFKSQMSQNEGVGQAIKILTSEDEEDEVFRDLEVLTRAIHLIRDIEAHQKAIAVTSSLQKYISMIESNYIKPFLSTE